MAPNQRFWHRIWEAATSAQIDDGESLDARIQQTVDLLGTPVFWLLGKTQSGKTSVVRALTGDDEAVVGNGFRACTTSSRVYDFPDSDDCLVRFLDTRGVGEVDYDPTDDLQQFENESHLLMVVVKAMDHAQRSVLEPLKRIRKAHPNWPMIVIQTCLHEGYPADAMRHTVPYPFDKPFQDSAVPSDLTRSLLAQREWFRGENIYFVPVDFTHEEDGLPPPDYGLDALWATIETAIPLGLREMLRQTPEARKMLADERYRAAQPIISRYMLAAGGVGAVPVPIVDVPLVLSIQAKMFHELANLYGQPMNAQRMAEISSALGLSYLGRLGVRGLLKFIPFAPIGSTVSAIYAGASTYALGNALCVYLARVRDGDIPDAAALRALYSEEFARARRWLGRRVANVAQGKVTK
jgi:uncharacterized protein (DUF697 family)